MKIKLEVEVVCTLVKFLQREWEHQRKMKKMNFSLCLSVLLMSSTVADAKSVRIFKDVKRSGREAVRQIHLKDFVSDIQSDEITTNPGLWSDTIRQNIILLKQLGHVHYRNPFHFTAPKKKKDLETKTNPFHFRPPAGDDGVRFSCPTCKDSSVKMASKEEMVALIKRKDTEKQHYVLLPE